jgi:transposase
VLSFSGSLTIWLAVQPCDMRKGFQGLMELVAANGGDLRSGALFVFGNRPRTRLKVLYYDGSGVWIMTKRLEKGTFAFPDGEEKVMRLRPEAFAMLTDGIDLRGARMRPWYQRD